MRQRLVGSLIVVACGLLPALIGGPVFAALLILLGAGGYREFTAMAVRAGETHDQVVRAIGYLVIAALGLAPLASSDALLLFAIVALAIMAPLISLLSHARDPGAFATWGLTSAGALYLGLPVYAGATLRSLPGTIDVSWLSDVAASLSPGWEPHPRGLAWALTVILATWIGDSVAYLGGRSLGRTKLAPSVSPGKTIEGAVCGLAGSAVVGAAAFVSFGLGPWPLGLLAGVVISLAGQLGDLSESLLKRQVGVKDSGALIPGHGGILDRIDALLFAFPATLVLAAGLERLGL